MTWEFLVGFLCGLLSFWALMVILLIAFIKIGKILNKYAQRESPKEFVFFRGGKSKLN